MTPKEHLQASIRDFETVAIPGMAMTVVMTAWINVVKAHVRVMDEADSNRENPGQNSPS